MSRKNSKTNENLDFFFARLDETGMSSYERIRAKAQMARAEAFADTVFAVARGLQRLLKARVIAPLRRMTASFG
jgi:hypothetical protein